MLKYIDEVLINSLAIDPNLNTIEQTPNRVKKFNEWKTSTEKTSEAKDIESTPKPSDQSVVTNVTNTDQRLVNLDEHNTFMKIGSFAGLRIAHTVAVAKCVFNGFGRMHLADVLVKHWTNCTHTLSQQHSDIQHRLSQLFALNGTIVN